MLAAAGVAPTVVHTSLLDRAVETAEIVLRGLGRSWVDVRRTWRLNTRHCGDLTGRNRSDVLARYGADQVWKWRRGYSTPAPPIRDDHGCNPNMSPAYRDLPPELLPRSECLADVEQRVMPYWYDALVPDLRAGSEVLVSTHGTPMKALIMHLDCINENDIADVNWGTGIPLLYELGSDMML